MKKINEINYFNFKDLCDCDPNEKNTGCKIFPKGNIDMHDPKRQIPESIHCKLGTNKIYTECPSINQYCDPLANKRYMTIMNTSQLSDMDAKSKCMFPFIFDRRDNQNNIECSVLPEPMMMEFTKNNTKYLAIGKSAYNQLETNFKNIQDNSLYGCITNLNHVEEKKAFKCLQESSKLCKDNVPSKDVRNCVIKEIRGNCLPLISNIDAVNKCLQTYKDDYFNQIKCPPETQNYTPFECIPESYKYGGPNEINDKIFTGKYSDYTGTKCLPSITQDGKVYPFFNENINECIYAHTLKIDKKENVNAYYCTGGIRHQYKNICDIQTPPNNSEYSNSGYMILQCNVHKPIEFWADHVPNESNSKATCIQNCPSGYIADFNNMTNGDNCIKFVTQKKDLTRLTKNSLGDEWIKYCAKNDNLENDACVKTININNINKSILGSYTCIPNLDSLPPIAVTYEEVANYCTDFKKIFTLDKLTEVRRGLQQIDNRPVFISKKQVNNKLEIVPKDQITINDYILNAQYSRIYIDEFLVKAINDKEFQANFEEITCNGNIKGYILKIKRIQFGGSSEMCCDNKGISYYNDLVSNTINPRFESSIIFKEGKKYTCDINVVKINAPCASMSGNLILLDKCLKENPEVCSHITGNVYYPKLLNPCYDKSGNALVNCLKENPSICPQFNGNIQDQKLLSCIKNNDLIGCINESKKICKNELREFCSSGGINLWGDGIPRILEIDNENNNKSFPDNLKYQRCGIDFQKKYPNEYNDVLEGICNQYDNRDNKGYDYYMTSNICINYCNNKEKNKVMSDCINKCYNKTISGNAYTKALNELIIQKCPPNSKDINGNVTCIKNFKLSNEKKEFDKTFKDSCNVICLEENKDKKFNGCNKGKKHACLRFDYDKKGNKINRFFTQECQDLFIKDPMYGLTVEGICVMNKTGDMYNYPECKQFREIHEVCINDMTNSNDNKVFKPECNNFCSKYKNICDSKLVDICDNNPFISHCDNNNFENLNDPDSTNKAYKMSANNRRGIEYAIRYDENDRNKQLDTVKYADKFKQNVKIFREEYLLNFCLNKNRQSNEKCEKIIDAMLNSPLIEKCTEKNNINNQPICNKLANSREKEFKEKVNNFCLDKKYNNREFNNCEIELGKCNLVKNDPIKYKECMAQYTKECSNYTKCTYDDEKSELCHNFKKYKIFYNHDICNDIRRKKEISNMKYLLIGGIISVVIIAILIKFFSKIKKNK
jgi:hypothetical protein